MLVKIIHEKDGLLGEGSLTHVPARLDWVLVGETTYQVMRVIWDLNHDPQTAELIVDDPRV